MLAGWGFISVFFRGFCAHCDGPGAAQYPGSSERGCRVIPLARLPSALQGYVAAAPGTPAAHWDRGQGPAPSPQPLQGPQELGSPQSWAWLWQCCPTGHPRVVGPSVRCGSGSQRLKLRSCSWGFFISTLKSFCSEISSQTCFSTLFLRRQIYICIRFILLEYTHSNDTSHWQCAVWWITPYKTHIWKENWRRNRIKSLYISDIMFCEDELQECLALLHSFGLFKGPTSVLLYKCKKTCWVFLDAAHHHQAETAGTKSGHIWNHYVLYNENTKNSYKLWFSVPHCHMGLIPCPGNAALWLFLLKVSSSA